MTRYGVRFDVAEGDERRMMPALRERAQDRPADLEGDDVDRALARAQARNLHDQRQRTVGTREAVDRRHAADVDQLTEAKAVDLAARFPAAHLRSAFEAPREPLGKPGRADLLRGRGRDRRARERT